MEESSTISTNTQVRVRKRHTATRKFRRCHTSFKTHQTYVLVWLGGLLRETDDHHPPIGELLWEQISLSALIIELVPEMI